jgi:glycerol-3-phosphate acyltransferase PlsY
LAGDFLKGLIPVLIANIAGASILIVAFVALAAFMGHLFPVFFGFQGGKGVATSFGAMLGISWELGVLVLATWLLVYKAFKISSLSALVAAVLIPIYAWFVLGSKEVVIVSIVISAILIWRHKSNIHRLLAGEET